MIAGTKVFSQEHQCVGKVIWEDGTWVRVDWENGKFWYYPVGDFRITKKTAGVPYDCVLLKPEWIPALRTNPAPTSGRSRRRLFRKSK
jgi:hypothetical protein